MRKTILAHGIAAAALMANTDAGTAAPATEHPTILTKMSIKSLNADPSEVKAKNDDGTAKYTSLDLVRIYGIATGLVFKEDPKTGDVQVAVSGNFEALNIKSGKIFRAGVLWLPGGIQELLIGAVDTGEKDANGKPQYNSVKFGFTIASVPAANPIGYSYTATQLIDAAQNDPLADLRSSLPALPAPAADAAKK